MKKLLHWSLMFVAGLFMVGAYSTNVFAKQEVPITTVETFVSGVVEFREDGTEFWETLTEDDATDGDFDNDGVLDEEDNCLIISNKDQADKDGNNVGHACEDIGFVESPTNQEGIVKASSFILPPDPDVRLCHHTDTGYTYIVDTTATEVLALFHALVPSHSNDIVEPFHFGFLNTLYYPGRNWTPENEELLENECQSVENNNTVTICTYEVNDEEGEHNPGMSGWTVGLNEVGSDDDREYEGVTGGDGCATFNSVNVAQYYVEEDMQTGWEYFSGAGNNQEWNIDSYHGAYTFNLINRRVGESIVPSR